MKNPVKLLVIVALLLAVSCGGKQVIYEGTAKQLNDEVLEELNKEGGFLGYSAEQITTKYLTYSRKYRSAIPIPSTLRSPN